MDFDLRDFLTTETGQVSFVSFAVFSVGWALKILYIWVQGHFQERVGEQKKAELEAETEQLNEKNFEHLLTMFANSLEAQAKQSEARARQTDVQTEAMTANVAAMRAIEEKLSISQSKHEQTQSLVSKEAEETRESINKSIQDLIAHFSAIQATVDSLNSTIQNVGMLTSAVDGMQAAIRELIAKNYPNPRKTQEIPVVQVEARSLSGGAMTSAEAVILSLDTEVSQVENGGEKAA